MKELPDSVEDDHRIVQRITDYRKNGGYKNLVHFKGQSENVRYGKSRKYKQGVV